MKKRISMLLAVAMLISVFCMTGAAAANTHDTAAGSIGSNVLTVKYNGEAVTFPDAQPFADENSRTLIPVRFVAETMGAVVSWNQETQTAVIEQNGITVSVPIGSDTITSKWTRQRSSGRNALTFLSAMWPKRSAHG